MKAKVWTRQTARSLMVLGTASHVGKSLLVAALCRIFKQEGFSVAPFKAQNMALNSAATPDGFEIGRAQAMQAEAAGIAPTVDMNPVLIKPSSEVGAQVVVRGRVWGEMTASDYHRRRVEELFPIVVESYERLAAKHDIIILEGAGSPAEINLKRRDIVNMRMAERADAACVLVGDIDRGGVFASLLGTLELLEADERARIRGFIINKFRGDESLLTPGVRMIEERIDKPCVGIVKYLHDINLDEEDSVALEDKYARGTERSLPEIVRLDAMLDQKAERRLRIAVIHLPHISNFTDFDALASEPSVALQFINRADDVACADVLIIPGTKRTIDDLQWLRQRGFDQAVIAHTQRGLTVGICGGMQMLGHEIADPVGLESGGRAPGLGLLPLRTVLAKNKVTVRARGQLLKSQLFGYEVECDQLTGYEIHLGATEYDPEAQPLMQLRRENNKHDPGTAMTDGATSDDKRIIGTYLHGFFDDDSFRHAFLHAARQACELAPPQSLASVTAEREHRFDRLADHVRHALDLDTMLDWLNLQK